MDDKTRDLMLRGEYSRNIANIRARVKLPEQQWWLSFVDENGKFLGVSIVHAENFKEATTDAHLNKCNPGGECQGMQLYPWIKIPKEWTYRLLTRAEAEELEKIMAEQFLREKST